MFLVSTSAPAQSLTVRAGRIIFDRPEFDSLVLVEFPFALNRAEFEFFRPDTAAHGYYSRIFAQINLFDSLGTPVDSANTYFSSFAEDSADALRENLSLFNSLTLAVRAGVYSGRLSVIDVVSKREGEFSFKSFAVEMPDRDRLKIGGLCLAYQAEFVGESAVSAGGVPRNGYRVLCNPDAIFSVKDTSVFVYAELYNLNYEEARPGKFRVGLSALDNSGHIFLPLGTRERTIPGRSTVIVESFDIGGWPAGSYALEVEVADLNGSKEVAREIPFEIVKPLPIAERGMYQSPDPLLGLDLATQLNLVQYLLTPDERSALERLNEAGKLSFLSQYWKERDSDPATPIIENLHTVYERYLYANNFLSTDETKTDGWKSDRGRILMVYGPSDKLEDLIHPTGDYPYQVWWYYSAGNNFVFVFTDDRGLGIFRLVHSTAEGEIYNEDWDEAIRSGFLELE